MKTLLRFATISAVALGLLAATAQAGTQSFNTSGTIGPPTYMKSNTWTVSLPAVTSIVTTSTTTASGAISGGSAYLVTKADGTSIGHSGGGQALPGTHTTSVSSGAQPAGSWRIQHAFGGNNVGTLSGNITTTFTW